MKLYQKIVVIGATIVGIGLTLIGCQAGPRTLEGTVKEEFGTAQRIVESSGSILGNESVKFGDPTYGLVLETDNGEYVISVRDNWRKPVYALAKAIEQGDRIKIQYNDFTSIGEDRIGATDSYTIKLIGKGNK